MAACWDGGPTSSARSQSFEQFSRKDADTLRRWQHEFVPIVQNILAREAKSPPLPPGERRRLLERSAAGRRLLEVSALSPLEFVQQEFEHPTVRAGLLFFNGLREVDLRVRGFGHHIAALLASPAKAQMSRGGTAALARALEAAVRESGGEIRLMTEPKRIVVGGRPRRRRRDHGRRVHPRAAFRRLLAQSAADLSRSARRGARPRAKSATASSGFQYNLLAPLFALHLNLREPPRYTASARSSRACAAP